MLPYLLCPLRLGDSTWSNQEQGDTKKRPKLINKCRRVLEGIGIVAPGLIIAHVAQTGVCIFATLLPPSLKSLFDLFFSFMPSPSSSIIPAWSLASPSLSEPGSERSVIRPGCAACNQPHPPMLSSGAGWIGVSTPTAVFEPPPLLSLQL